MVHGGVGGRGAWGVGGRGAWGVGGRGAWGSRWVWCIGE